MNPITPAAVVQQIEETVSTPVVPAPLSDLSTQINNHHQRALSLANSSIEYALKCGHALIEAKAQLPHGRWIPWLRGNCPDICTRQVQRYMRLADNWPQIEAERKVHPEEMLTVSGALALISDNVAGPNTTSKSHLEQTSATLPNESVHGGMSNTNSGSYLEQTSATLPNESVHGEMSNTNSGSYLKDEAVSAVVLKQAPKTTRPQTGTKEAAAEVFEEKADSVVRHTIPGIQETAKSLHEYLLARNRSGVDTDRVLTLSAELTEIFLAAKREVSRCK